MISYLKILKISDTFAKCTLFFSCTTYCSTTCYLFLIINYLLLKFFSHSKIIKKNYQGKEEMLRDLDFNSSTNCCIISLMKGSGNLSLIICCHLSPEKKSPRGKHI